MILSGFLKSPLRLGGVGLGQKKKYLAVNLWIMIQNQNKLPISTHKCKTADMANTDASIKLNCRVTFNLKIADKFCTARNAINLQNWGADVFLHDKTIFKSKRHDKTKCLEDLLTWKNVI